MTSFYYVRDLTLILDPNTDALYEKRAYGKTTQIRSP